MSNTKTERITIRVSPELQKRIQQVSEKERRSMSDTARLIIEEAINAYVREDKAPYSVIDRRTDK
jgi:predicted transcriptional regulator